MDGNPMMMFGAAGAAASYFMLLNATVFLATQERDRRRSNIGFGLHFGPGVYDDYEFLFSEEGRAGYSDGALAAFDRQFQRIFRLDVKSYEYVSSRLHGRLTRRRRGRGNPGVDHKCGFPGRMADPKILRYTPLWRNAMELFGRHGFYICGDAAYPLKNVS